MGKRFIKRAMDLGLSFFLILMLLPVFVLVSILSKIKFGRSVFFIQERPGQNEKIFKLYKFRTMTDKKSPSGELLPDKDRITKYGQFLRRISLDELPELFNILKGDMSFVGPRPLLIEYLPLYNKEQRKRHLVKPGLTGWAQVNGRNAITWQEKFNFDVWYVNNWSLGLDIKIIFLTLVKIFKQEGISQEGQATMTKFKG